MGKKEVSEWLVGKSDLTNAVKEREERRGAMAKMCLVKWNLGRYDTMVQSLSHTQKLTTVWYTSE